MGNQINSRTYRNLNVETGHCKITVNIRQKINKGVRNRHQGKN